MTDIELANIRYALERYGIAGDINRCAVIQEGPDNVTLSLGIGGRRFLLVADDYLADDGFYERQVEAEPSCRFQKIDLVKQHRNGSRYETMLGNNMMCRLYELKSL